MFGDGVLRASEGTLYGRLRWYNNIHYILVDQFLHVAHCRTKGGRSNNRTRLSDGRVVWLYKQLSCTKTSGFCCVSI